MLLHPYLSKSLIEEYLYFNIILHNDEYNKLSNVSFKN